ncbi:hypothetical protein XENOCAPTIV_025818 [Xenoophorus captivus]|uniref:Uncharacterized protein n=1 Tax=Xenoophorus captivus TaxID=1517983 RepID=A0ABV0R370_9TELE
MTHVTSGFHSFYRRQWDLLCLSLFPERACCHRVTVTDAAMGITALFLLSVLGFAITAEGKNCGPLDDVNNGIIEYRNGTEFGDTAVVICNQGLVAKF